MAIQNTADESPVANDLACMLKEFGAQSRNVDKLGKAILIFKSGLMQKCIETTLIQAKNDETHLMILGETGTGKELIAQLIRLNSQRKYGLYDTINCAAIPETLADSVLFGYRKGAFTGAGEESAGFFRKVTGGTLFLDEFTEFSPAVQAKLLRVAQNGEIFKTGGNHSSRVDVRIISATNKDVERAIKEGKLRSDLYYRLSAIEITLPPLRRRSEDVPALATFFANKGVLIHGKRDEIITVSDSALDVLQSYAWPGNVRELENVINGIAFTVREAGRDKITPEDLPTKIRNPTKPKKQVSVLPKVSYVHKIQSPLSPDKVYYIFFVHENRIIIPTLKGKWVGGEISSLQPLWEQARSITNPNADLPANEDEIRDPNKCARINLPSPIRKKICTVLLERYRHLHKLKIV
ncbi:MAG: sigma 54-interacting transcriptional regulator [Alphaproteobacteria bacterium]|nr:sigma 54-interacting transcriptional regulator [Alphaproteobacteria bacterium]